ncbi:nucleoside 2-deoxyribosyltransferase [Tetragenococcus koreensis]|uniref:Nucleoside 2-deoxyribosyltransferase n=1 Tax=Tetragenococcus koreensis TaxID=290335 RepID=A0AAN4UDC8_9ENTE|nr:nucleoside 2-deoxyribosyltransferase [Tetragenococcus koreensis]AYW45116.1 nucleoside 2-deoxyribosyltransferase [Tetragenococcus koreensis]MCF1584312.1 nucleoside 2-deoxyribosyltransferase [Tetragenococcus koreensis]MCF1613861.1 nucleoside 2-deoxyribosyltransferase [Tetragenococcus koreensis]MCF1616053.1 nucleoside 2-deoxyribosyltransferase [Tetragenococcus koreensis]MCF1618595.1 nucleoside 2-deoxyribosyltransferase [Tetragenococcus koreensis]
MKVYFAAPMFAKSDLIYNSYLVEKIREKYPELIIYMPQENGAINDKTAFADSKMIALADTEKVEESQLMIALLDGITIDNGVASEIGVAYAHRIPVLGLYTDSRQQGADNQQKLDALSTVAENQFHYLNLYTAGLVKLNGQIYSSEEDLLNGVDDFVNNERSFNE